MAPYRNLGLFPPINECRMTVRHVLPEPHTLYLIGSVRSGYPVEGAAALGFRVRILRSSSGMK